tara:strand:- start:231 stop:848 length:618 start_codon:yes stop_codon:yes gene_type:complete
MFVIKRDEDIIVNKPEVKKYIYRFKCLINQKSYVGSTNDPIRRFKEHLGQRGSKALLYDLVEYGRRNFEITLLDMVCDEELTDIIEDHWITKLDAIENGYNCKMNRPPKERKDLDLEGFDLKAKFTSTSDGSCYFSVGELSLFNEYERLMGYTASNLQHKIHNGYKYIRLEIESDTEYKKDKLYTLHLRLIDDRFVLVMQHLGVV